MATRPGEENVATLFGDVHYFYGPAEVKPRHHRFDKGSYVYLFENASERRCRIEVANHPGTDDQDAFEGFLDQTFVRYSYKHACMVSLTVSESVSQDEWHLPTYDPRNENKYHYKLHSLDIYFWTQKDALQFVNGVRRVLPPAQVEVLDEPAPPPQAAPMSSVVQKLENVAISDPQYGSANPSSQRSSQNVAPTAPAANAPGVPPAGVQPGSTEPALASIPPPPPPPANFAPMAYNPAAPAAPETIQHREKTPPPDEDPLNPLAVAVAYDYQGQPFTPGMPSHFQPGGLASPGLNSQFAAPQAAHPGLQRAATMPVQPPLGSPYGANFPGTPGLPPAPPPPAQPQSQPQPAAAVVSPPPSSYSQHTYGQQQQQQQQPGQVDYSIHQQLYRPTQTEISNSHMDPDSSKYQGKEPKGRLEVNAGRFDRGVSGMLRKFEKKFG